MGGDGPQGGGTVRANRVEAPPSGPAVIRVPQPAALSVSIVPPGPQVMALDSRLALEAKGQPEGGTFRWTIGGLLIVQIDGPADQPAVRVKAKDGGRKTLSIKPNDVTVECKYTVPGGREAKADVKVTVLRFEIDPNVTGFDVGAGKPLNAIRNPAAAVIDAAATSESAAVVEITEVALSSNTYAPDKNSGDKAILNIAKDDGRVEWGQEGPGAVEFVGSARGRRVRVTGKSEGEVVLLAKVHGGKAGMYRMLVVPKKKVPFRVNILRSAKSEVPAEAQDLEKLAGVIDIANRLFRQVGVELVPDDDATIDLKATIRRMAAARNAKAPDEKPYKDVTIKALDRPGFFSCTVPDGLTRNLELPKDEKDVAVLPSVRVNARNRVLQLQVLHSFSEEKDAKTLGMAVNNPASGAGTEIEDRGTPSTALIKPTGIPPDGPASKVKVKLLEAALAPNQPEIWGLVLSAQKLGAKDSSLGAGNVLAHEVGHCLNLHHRGTYRDGLKQKLDEYARNRPITNLMFSPADSQANPKSNENEKLDVIQCKAIHKSPMLQPPGPPSGGP